MGAYRRMDLEQQNFDYAAELLCQGEEYFKHTFLGYQDGKCIVGFLDRSVLTDSPFE